jgi:hypothetical protein
MPDTRYQIMITNYGKLKPEACSLKPVADRRLLFGEKTDKDLMFDED